MDNKKPLDNSYRQKCYQCYRPKSSCICKYINPIDTNAKFVILMHPKEFKKVKNNTGRFTHLLLKNSELFIGIDFSNHKQINEIIQTHQSYILFPSKEAHNLSDRPIEKTQKPFAFFIIDATWACAKSIFRQSKNLQNLLHVSFQTKHTSMYQIKQQPDENYLSTIESTLVLLELLNQYKLENTKDLQHFLDPFFAMIEYQKECIAHPKSNSVRYKKRG